MYYGCRIESLHEDGSLDKYNDTDLIYISSPIEYVEDPQSGESTYHKSCGPMWHD